MLWRQRVRGELRSSMRRVDLSRIRREMCYEFLPPSDSRYLTMFQSAGGRVAGEITPAYSLLSDSEVKRVAALLPDARVIIMLRNPIGRAWSQVQLETGPTAESGRRHGPRRLRRLAGAGQLPGDRRSMDGPLPQGAHLRRFRRRGADPSRSSWSGRLSTFLGVDPDRLGLSASGPMNGSGVTTIPTALAVDLARRYAAVLEEMSLRFGGPAEAWRSRCRAVVGVSAADRRNWPCPWPTIWTLPFSHLTSGALAA